MLILEPLAAIKWPEGGCLLFGVGTGKMQTPAPLSAKKCVPVRRSHTDKVLFVHLLTATVTGGRRWRFPDVAVLMLVLMEAI